jgi:aryl-alcohol dehydrogenase-like predicted oxidoreductase
MQWVGQQAPDCVIVGVDNAEQLRANAGALETPGGDEEREALRRVRQSEPFQAYERRKEAEFFERLLPQAS